MQLIFAQPEGFWGLLGLPAIIAIHFLQQQRHVVSSSTLFLLEQLLPASQRSRQFDWIRSSRQLWLQLLVVCIVSLILSDPHFIGQGTVQRVGILLDDSMSMRAAKERIARELPSKITSLASQAETTEWLLLGSAPPLRTLYRGINRNRLLKALEEWDPLSTSHDLVQSAIHARRLVGSKAVLIAVSDQHHKLDEGVHEIGFGKQIENCALSSPSFTQKDGVLFFKVIAKNYGKEVQKRSWWIENPSEKGTAQTIELAPGAQKTLHGKFPEGSERIEIHLSPDDFTEDDLLPLVRPTPPELSVYESVDSAHSWFVHSVEATLKRVRHATVEEHADVAVQSIESSSDSLPNIPAILLSRSAAPGTISRRQPIIVEQHPLVAHLAWDTLLASPTMLMPFKENDIPLLWQGSTPIVILRESNQPQLLINFDIARSNADKIPAFVIMIYRFLENQRNSKLTTHSGNIPSDARIWSNALRVTDSLRYQREDLQSNPQEIATIAPHALGSLKSPSLPGFFALFRNNDRVFLGASYLADSRESDFSRAETFAEESPAQATMSQRYFQDPAYPLLLFAILCALLWMSWLRWGGTRLGKEAL